MKSTLIFMGIFLLLITESQAQTGQRNNPAQRTCKAPGVVQRALNTLSLGDVKNQLARKLNLPVATAQRQHVFNFENQQINRVRLIGNNCNYFTPNSSDPVYTIRLF